MNRVKPDARRMSNRGAAGQRKPAAKHELVRVCLWRWGDQDYQSFVSKIGP